MGKIASLWNLFRQGAVVADPKAWKTRQISVTVLAGLILAVVNAAASFGYSLPIDTDTANAIAGGILAIVNTVLTIITTDKVGIGKAPNQVEEAESSVKPGSQSTSDVNVKDIKDEETYQDIPENVKNNYPFTGASSG